jgi:hypothetical protein
MDQRGMERRDFLKLGALTGAAGLVNTALPRVSFAMQKPAELDRVLNLSPVKMAEASKMVNESWQYLRRAAYLIKNPGVRRKVEGILENPAPTFAARLKDPDAKQTVYNNLIAQGYLSDQVSIEQFLPPSADNPNKSVQPFFSAPGSGYQGHHSYPGGLALHTALNLNSSLGLFEGYRQVNHAIVDRDVVIASQMLHDLLKPWVFQWLATGESRPEVTIAGTGEHHIYSIAESIHRGLPAKVCVAQACAHDHPGAPDDEKQVVGWIKAACILLDVDPVEKGLLSETADTVPVPRRIENFICHLGDHDWVLSGLAATSMIAQLKEVAVNEYGMTDADLQGLKFNAFRNYVFSQASILHLYLIYSAAGAGALVEKILSVVTPA